LAFGVAQAGMPGRTLHPLLRELRRVARGAHRRPARLAETLSLVGRVMTQAETLTVEEQAGAVIVRILSRHAAAACTLTCVVQDAHAVSPLTSCEQAVAEHVCNGLTLAQTARLRGVSINTIKSQVRQVFRKLNVDSRVALLRKLGP
jgi:DNA-binding NarL/FixJ family response regulator